jgi:hypothetical protein
MGRLWLCAAALLPLARGEEVLTMTRYDAEIYSGQTAALTVSYSFTEASQIKCLIKSSSGGTASAAVTSESVAGDGSLSLEVAVSSLDGVSCDYYWRCYSFYETASNTWSERTTLVDQDAGAVCSATPAPTAAPTGSPPPTTSAPIPQPTSSFAPTAAPIPVPTACGPREAADAPEFPAEDASITTTASRVVTRATNSELVDLGHPGAFVSGSNDRRDCPDRAGGLLAWHDPATWADGAVPAVGADVVVSGDVLISSCSLSEGTYGVVTVSKGSSLVFADEPIELHVEGIVVEGELVIGSPGCRTMSPVSITLHGARPDDTMVAQDPSIKGIDVKNGTLELHGGLYVQTWSRLAVTAAAGDSSILIQDAVNWAVGDEIFVAGTTLRDDRAWHQNERFTVADVRAASHLGDDVVFVELSGALLFDHYGGDEYQAEVGLLSRRIVVQGAAEDSEPTDAETVACPDVFWYGHALDAEPARVGVLRVQRLRLLPLRGLVPDGLRRPRHAPRRGRRGPHLGRRVLPHGPDEL